jgi:hypothetical protein
MNFSKLPSWTWTAGGLGLALAAGVMIGRVSAPGAEAGSAGESLASGKSGGRDSRGGLSSEERSARSRESARSSKSGASEQDLSKILSSTNRLERTEKLLAYLDRLPVEQFASVYEQLRLSPSTKVLGSERSLVLQAWADRDPLSAIGFLQQNGAEDWERETAVSTWASKDPQAAFAWAATAKDEGGGDVNNWILGAARGIAMTNPELARDYLSQMEGETRDRALRDMQPYVAQYGFDYASNWVSAISDEGLRSQASRSMARSLAELDPAQAGKWNAAIADVKTRRDVSETVSDAWAKTDLAAARKWVEGLPEDTRTEAAEGIARNYAQQDPVAAAQWLSGLGNNPDLDGARRILIEESFRSSPQQSLDFVATLSDQKSREGYYYRYVSGWMKQDADAARTWVSRNTATLPASLVERISRQ